MEWVAVDCRVKFLVTFAYHPLSPPSLHRFFFFFFFSPQKNQIRISIVLVQFSCHWRNTLPFNPCTRTDQIHRTAWTTFTKNIGGIVFTNTITICHVIAFVQSSSSCIYIYIYVRVCVYIYIYIYIYTRCPMTILYNWPNETWRGI